MAKKELTLQDVSDSMNERFNFVSTQFSKLESSLGLVLSQLQKLNSGQQQIESHLKEHDDRFDELEETLQAIENAVDKDAVTIVKYGKRIEKLEKAH